MYKTWSTSVTYHSKLTCHSKLICICYSKRIYTAGEPGISPPINFDMWSWSSNVYTSFCKYIWWKTNIILQQAKAFEMALLTNSRTSPPPLRKNPVWIPAYSSISCNGLLKIPTTVTLLLYTYQRQVWSNKVHVVRM